MISAGRTYLSQDLVQALAGFADVDEWQMFLQRAYSAIRVQGDKIDGHHTEWNDLVRKKLAGKTLGECHRTLAEGTPDWHMSERDRDYWLLYSPYHLIAILDADKCTRIQKEEACEAWLKRMNNPAFLADRGALSGVDSLVADLAEGVLHAEIPEEDWKDAWTIFSRDAPFLRSLACSNT